MGGHDWFDGFDKRACYGDHPETDEVCPKLKQGAVDSCGVCGCTIVGLSLAETPPSDCVRRNLHAPATDGGVPLSKDPAEDAPDARARLIKSQTGWEVVALNADCGTVAEAANREQTVAEYVDESDADDVVLIEMGRSYNVKAKHPGAERWASMNLLEYALRKLASRLESEDDVPLEPSPDVDRAWDLVELDQLGDSDGNWRASHLFTGFARMGGTRAGALKNLSAALENHTWLD